MKRLKIDDRIRRKAKKCVRDFACLCGDEKCLQNVEHTLQGSVCYVNCEEKGCAYRVSHGFLGVVCSCPVRVEIFKRHGK